MQCHRRSSHNDLFLMTQSLYRHLSLSPPPQLRVSGLPVHVLLLPLPGLGTWPQHKRGTRYDSTTVGPTLLEGRTPVTKAELVPRERSEANVPSFSVHFQSLHCPQAVTSLLQLVTDYEAAQREAVTEQQVSQTL